MDQIIAFLNNQQFAILFALVVPWIVKYVPAFRSVSNQILALLAALTAWLTNVLGATPAHAAFLGGVFGAAGSVFIPVLDALITKVIHDAILNPAYKAFGLKTPQ